MESTRSPSFTECQHSVLHIRRSGIHANFGSDHLHSPYMSVPKLAPLEDICSRTAVSTQLLEQRLSVLEVGGVEPFVNQLKASAARGTFSAEDSTPKQELPSGRRRHVRPPAFSGPIFPRVVARAK